MFGAGLVNSLAKLGGYWTFSQQGRLWLLMANVLSNGLNLYHSHKCLARESPLDQDMPGCNSVPCILLETLNMVSLQGQRQEALGVEEWQKIP